MATRIGINGFGRIGRGLARILESNDNLELVAYNARSPVDEYARLLKYDSVHGRFDAMVEYDEDNLIVNGRKIRAYHWPKPAECKWGDAGVDIVVEATGKFKDRDSCEQHLAAGAKKVMISAPTKGEDLTIVYNVNHEDYDPARHNIVSAASCTTNALAPMAQVVHQEFGIQYGLMTTIHSYTTSQAILDGPAGKDPRRGRAAALSQIPTSTGAAQAVTLVLPELKGRLDGLAVRVPTPDASLIDAVFHLEKETDAETLNAAFKKRVNETLGYTDDYLVSTDFIGDSHGTVVDGLSTKVIQGRLAKVLSWYDNEHGFTSQLIRCIEHLAKHL
ncbi:type I glyceraldehyde-3-phosphate dehydrogenase [Oceanidesulfovibrio marinus]|uniref:Glyceraldehyde-3-phosphate dehydrogenase n=1 Tax=Oceanidesulfovibrio marinus TaxID=370038 RepID=A0A6P1ZG86_9BACT|nr:type I glyceraldehyde-3-phosphate dehydrogenase [Oceanidesulfovibrio marinus]QJT10766.1 type I glyceraldehyde-3-phosphate dehydrogenase [Oceanidesulfovibrio marinus]TVM31931.1 type I glyceraldehyde-3-phosphate dehydrogenase [Oceanidesulfovibrio marinus]